MKRLALILTVLLALGVLGARAEPAFAQDDGAVAINTEDGSNLFEFAFKIRRVMNDVVDQTNAAVAYSSCTECQTVAVAIQIVLVYSDPSVVTPENVAVAVNENCDTCESVASAYQFVFSVPDKFKFSRAAWIKMIRIRLQIARLGRDFEQGELSATELAERLDVLTDELRAVIKADIERAAKERERERDRDRDRDRDDGDDESNEDQDADSGEEPEETTTTTPETTPTVTETTEPETTTTTP